MPICSKYGYFVLLRCPTVLSKCNQPDHFCNNSSPLVYCALLTTSFHTPGAKDDFHALLRVLKSHKAQQEHMTSFLCLICPPPILDWRARSLKRILSRISGTFDAFTLSRWVNSVDLVCILFHTAWFFAIFSYFRQKSPFHVRPRTRPPRCVLTNIFCKCIYVDTYSVTIHCM